MAGCLQTKKETTAIDSSCESAEMIGTVKMNLKFSINEVCRSYCTPLFVLPSPIS